MITIEGVIGKNICDRGDWKMYSFLPLQKYQDMVVLDKKYGTIVITGIMPDLIPGMQYKIDVEYSQRGQYHNYEFKKVYVDNGEYTPETSIIFLKEMTSENRAKILVDAYPDIIDRMINDKPIDISKLRGIGKTSLDKIVVKVKENHNIIALVDEYSEYGMTFAMMNKLYNYYDKSIDKIKQMMYENPYECLCSINRVGFKTADKIIMSKYPERIDSETRCRAAVEFLLSQNETEGNTWINLKTLYNKLLELAYEARIHFQEIVENSPKDIFFDVVTNKVSTVQARICEAEIANRLSAHLDESSVLNIDCSKYRNVEGIDLTDEQMGIFDNVCKYNVSILAGVGGSGKSFSVQALLNMLKDNRISYELFSSTGKAAKVLSEYTKEDASTIHRGLKYSPKEGFAFNDDNKLETDVLIIDEFSMIDIFLLRDLLRAVDPSETKLLFIGDPAQIPSVGVGNIAFDMLQSKRIPTTLLTKVFRYGEGGLSYVATKVRNGENYITSEAGIQKYGVKEDYVFVNVVQEDSPKCLKVLYNNLLKKNVPVEDIMVLTSYNKGEYGTVNINKIVQEHVNPKGAEVTANRFGVPIIFRVGDKVMQIKNNYTKETTNDGETTAVFNGDTGFITSIDKEELMVNFDGVHVKYNTKNLNELDLAYCITIHKSQGSSAKYVILITPKAHKFFLNRNLLYVAVSRAKEGLYHIGSVDVIKSALRKSANLSRDTFLKDFLENKIKNRKKI